MGPLSYVQIRIPPSVDPFDCDALAQHLQTLVDGELSMALDTDVSDHDIRAHPYEVEITEVVLSGDDVEVAYSVRWAAYHGCSDQNDAGIKERQIEGTVLGDVLTFPWAAPRTKRSTLDEF